MNDVERRALAMVDRISGPLGCSDWSDATRADIIKALIEAIESGDAERAAHDAFRQEVSEAVQEAIDATGLSVASRSMIRNRLSRFIIQPKTDPLVEAVKALQDGRAGSDPESYAACLRNELKSRGQEIREAGQ